MKSLARPAIRPGGREIGPFATAGRVAGGLLVIAVATVPDGVSSSDVVAALAGLPLVAAAVEWPVRAAHQPRAPERLAARHSLSAPGLRTLGLAIAIAIALTFVTPMEAPAIWLSFGVSMLVAALRGQGGCEVVALPNLLFGREDRVACVLYAPLDAVDSRIGYGEAPRASRGAK